MLCSNNDLVIQKSDKGNNVVILPKRIYIERVMDILSDNTKFRNVVIPKDNPLRRILNKENQVRKVIKDLCRDNKISKARFESLWPVGSQPGILYGLAKVHKLFEMYPKVRPILSAVGTPTHALAKYLVSFFSSVTTNEYTVKDSFSFSKEIAEHHPGLYMCSLDRESLFTNLPLEKNY